MRFSFIAITFLLMGCTQGINMRSVNYDYLFNNGNSRVWIVNKAMKDNYIVSSYKTEDKHLMIFHSDGTYQYIPVKDITKKAPQEGYYYLNSEEKELELDTFDEESWIYDLAYLNEDSILLVPRENSDSELTLQLKPFPKL